MFTAMQRIIPLDPLTVRPAIDPNESVAIIFVPRRRKRYVFFEGNTYIPDRKQRFKRVWNCSMKIQRGCQASVITRRSADRTELVRAANAIHTHAPMHPSWEQCDNDDALTET